MKSPWLLLLCSQYPPLTYSVEQMECSLDDTENLDFYYYYNQMFIGLLVLSQVIFSKSIIPGNVSSFSRGASEYEILPLTLALPLFFGVTEGIQLWCIFYFCFLLFLGYWHSSVQVSSVFWEASSTPRWRLAGQPQTSVPLLPLHSASKRAFRSYWQVKPVSTHFLQ